MRLHVWLVIGALVVGSLGGFVVGRAAPMAALRTDGQIDLMDGWAQIRQGNSDLNTGGPGADSEINGGVQYLYAASFNLSAAGIYGVQNMATSVQHAEYLREMQRGSAKDSRIITTFLSAFAPFARMNAGTIPDAQLQGAISRVTALPNDINSQRQK